MKPDNILLKDDKSIKNVVIADFGLATELASGKEAQILFKRCGTPGYVAPEVLRWHEGDPFYNEKCDIFSVGCIFYLLYFFFSLIKII